jgi:diguanylate cyclase (GGDEF)-like protein/PAS domain S-box-containing protein
VTSATERRTRLLLVEASDADADLFDVILHGAAPAAFEVVRTATLADATAFLRTKTADCAIVGVGLPDSDDLEIVETVVVGWPAVALVVLTDQEDDALGEAALKTGASDYLSKTGLEGELLVRSIRYSILRKRIETSLAEAQGIARVGSWELDLETDAVTWSRELCRLFGFGWNVKPTYEGLIERTHLEDREPLIQALRATMLDFRPFVVEHRLVLPDGTMRWVRSRGRVELDASGRPDRLLGTAQDITEQKAANEALLHQAFHDPLTGLPNRPLFIDRLGQGLKRLERLAATVAVIYLDIDRFKVINDSLGYVVGNQLLLSMAARLNELLLPGETLARIGGDEFVMLCEGLAGEAEAVGIADRVCAALNEPLSWDGGNLVLSVSAGVALSTSSSVSPDSLLRDAEAAMYRAKGEGRARSAVFAETMRAAAVGRLDTEIALRQAIVNGDLRVVYQQIVALADGRVLGHEALVRWAHPTKGLVGPEEFIAIAEETGLIVPLGTWVLREACLQARSLQRRNAAWSDLTMSVNLSGRQLGQSDLVEHISSALHDADLRPEHLQLEMTESVLIDDASRTISLLESLKTLGVHLSVDDFGTGYSSLAYLRRLPVDVLKIDRIFVNGLGSNLEDSAVAAAVVSLADTLGLATIAEGVETSAQRDCLVELGCDRAQGYLYARPATAAECGLALDRLINGRDGALAPAGARQNGSHSRLGS